MTATKTKTLSPFCHWELLSQRGEDDFGFEPYVFVLQRDYQTNGTDKIMIDNIRHSADVMNGKAEQDIAHYPYVRYLPFPNTSGKRKNVWVYVSQRLIPTETKAIEAWMLAIANANFKTGLMVDSTPNIACLYKLKWISPDIK